MTKTNKELIARQREINAALANASEEEAKVLMNEYNQNKRSIETNNQEAVAKANAPKAVKRSANEMFREYITDVRNHKRDSQAIVTSAILADGDTNNMESAGLPVTIKDLINPLEMGTIYEQLGLQVATGVHGQIQWPVLDTIAKVVIAGETVKLSATPIDFSKITATPVRMGITVEVDNESINDAAFDLVGCVTTQINKSLGRVINEAVLKTTAFADKFYGPFANKNVQSVAFATAGAPTYKELLEMKGKVLATGAQMAGFCYIMDAAMYSALEATPIDNGSGLMIIQGGKINGAPVFITDLADYSGKVAAGCFGYAALNQHGQSYFIVDPYTKADQNVVKFTLNCDWSLTTLQGTPFVIGK